MIYPVSGTHRQDLCWHPLARHSTGIQIFHQQRIHPIQESVIQT
ncbi:hypothetical protein [Methylovulum sp.]|nr:hypothetical protein [Methylovulum sp.]